MGVTRRLRKMRAWGAKMDANSLRSYSCTNENMEPERIRNLCQWKLCKGRYAYSATNKVTGHRWNLQLYQCATWSGLSHIAVGGNESVLKSDGGIITRGSCRNSKRNTLQCHFVHHESQVSGHWTRGRELRSQCLFARVMKSGILTDSSYRLKHLKDRSRTYFPQCLVL
jgi:hypothetical protein